MLDVKDINTYYGLSHILFDVSLSVQKGEVVCLLGRNGAGKSTTMKSIMGLTPPKQGEIVFKGNRVTGMPAYQMCRKGVGFVPDDRRVFADLTVGENLEISARPRQDNDGWSQERVYNFFPALRDLSGRRAGVLSGGEQQMLTIGRALITNPDLLLLDEPTEGLAPIIVEMLEEKILELKASGLSVLLAEQNQNVALRLSDRAYIIDNGRIRYQGSIEDLRQNEAIRHKYLLV
jgi:branched-chain amino acid transport system ATP-binding protein